MSGSCGGPGRSSIGARSLDPAASRLTGHIDSLISKSENNFMRNIVIALSVAASLAATLALWASPSESEARQRIIETAESFQGVPYVYGAESPEAFDCSGLVQYVYAKAADLQIPRNSKGMWEAGQKVEIGGRETGRRNRLRYGPLRRPQPCRDIQGRRNHHPCRIRGQENRGHRFRAQGLFLREGDARRKGVRRVFVSVADCAEPCRGQARRPRAPCAGIRETSRGIRETSRRLDASRACCIGPQYGLRDSPCADRRPDQEAS